LKNLFEKGVCAAAQGTDRDDEHLNIFLEFVPGGSIASLLTKFGDLAVLLAMLAHPLSAFDNTHVMLTHPLLAFVKIDGGAWRVDSHPKRRLAEYQP
jgi:hypothetical protein